MILYDYASLKVFILIMDGKNKYFMKIKIIFYLNVVVGWNLGINIMIMISIIIRWVNCIMTNIIM